MPPTDDKDDKDDKVTKDDDTTAAASDAAASDAAAEKVVTTTPAVVDEPVVDAKPAAAAPMTTAEADSHQHDDGTPGVAEPDRINVGMILAITVAIFVSTLVVVIGVREFFAQTIQGEVNKKVLEPEDPLKKELYVVEAAKLSKYQWVSQKDGIVRIPLVRAKELVLADYGKLAAYEPGAPGAAIITPEPAPSSAPATSASAASSVAPSGSGSGAPMPSVAPPASAFGSAATSAAPKTSAPAKASASAPHSH